jgi:hypothetical protein
MTNPKWVPALAFIGAICGCATAPKTQVQAGASLPVYEVAKAGASDAEAAALADQLRIPAKALVSAGGLLSFVDPEKYLAIPAAAVDDPKVTDGLRDATENRDESRPIDMRAIDTAALATWPVLDARTALDSAARSLEASGLRPQFGTPAAGHTVLTLYSGDGSGKWTSKEQELDTQVSYTFSEANGYPLVGPGAQVQVTYDGAGHVSRLHYATRQLKAGPSVKVISEREARDRIARLLPDGAEITTRLVYWSPPLRSWQARPDGWSPAAIIPWYAYYSTTRVAGPGNNAVSVINSKVQMIPATDDERFVPAVQLLASAKGPEVSAHVSVAGGRPPYSYVWGGSNPDASNGTADSVAYTATVRVAEPLVDDPRFRLDRDETVAVTVTDANGVAVRARQTVRVHATRAFPREMDKKKKHGSTPTYGIESPGAPAEWMEDQVGWLQGMSTPSAGGGTLNFCWMGASAWPGDFINPDPQGTLVATPWVNGDADYANWGVNTADMVLDNADGNADGKTAMQPGAPLSKYATAALQSPNNSVTVGINLNGFGSPSWLSVNYADAWGPTGKYDTLYWLLLDDCDMLDNKDGSGLNVADRWGPAFNGLHILTGFASLDQPDGYGNFERDFATDMLGVITVLGMTLPVVPQTIVQSWFSSAQSNGIGTAAAMGPALFVGSGKPYSMANLNDYYWGKGSVGPTIVPKNYAAKDIGWWYITTTTPANVVFP